MKAVMRTALLPTVLMLIVGTRANAAEIRWEPSLSAALARAKQTQQVVMVDFYTDWCGWCKKLDKDTYTDTAVIEASRKLIAVKVNAEKEGAEAAHKYKVTGYPTILFLSGAGTVEGKISGYMPGTEFANEMNKVIARSRETPLMEARLRKNAGDLEAIGKLAPVYASRGDIARAHKLIAQGEKVDPSNKRGLLSAAYNALGDYYQERDQYPQAIALFKKATRTARNPEDMAYANISIAACYLTKNDSKNARPYLQAALQVKGAPASLRAQAQAMLQYVNRRK